MIDKKVLNIAKEVIKLELISLKKLKSSIGKSFEQIVKTILNCKSGKVIISGVGKSGIIGKKMVCNVFFYWDSLLFFRCIKCKSWGHGSNNF